MFVSQDGSNLPILPSQRAPNLYMVPQGIRPVVQLTAVEVCCSLCFIDQLKWMCLQKWNLSYRNGILLHLLLLSPISYRICLKNWNIHGNRMLVKAIKTSQSQHSWGNVEFPSTGSQWISKFPVSTGREETDSEQRVFMCREKGTSEGGIGREGRNEKWWHVRQSRYRRKETDGQRPAYYWGLSLCPVKQLLPGDFHSWGLAKTEADDSKQQLLFFYLVPACQSLC